MNSVPAVARALVRIHVNKSDGLRKYMKLATTRGEQIMVVRSYVNKHPNLSRLMTNAGMSIESLTNLLNDRK